MRFSREIMLAACLSAIAAPAAAQSIGDRLTCTSISFTCSPGSATVGNGVEFVYGPATTAFLNLNFSENLLTVTGRFNAIQLGSGQTISFRDTTNAFTSATFLSSTNSAFSASDLSFAGGVVTLNVGSKTFTSSGDLRIALTTAAAAVPEPASWAMTILGFGVVGASLRRRRTRPGRLRAA